MLNCRPNKIDEIIGLKDIKEIIKYSIGGARLRNAQYPHFVISSPPGLGKTTIANIIATTIEGEVHSIIGSELSNEDDVYTLAARVKDNDVVFVEEAHSMGRKAMILLLPWLEQNILYGFGGVAPKCVFLFPTTDAGKLSAPLRQRCRPIHIDYYSTDEIIEILLRAANLNNCKLDDEDALILLAKSSRGTPRIALEDRLVPVMNIMKVDDVPFSVDVVRKMFAINAVNEYGLDRQDILYCQTLRRINDITNIPVSLSVLANSTGLAQNVLLNVIEPFLLRAGIIIVGSRGRELTRFGKELFTSKFTDVEEIYMNTENTVVTVTLPFTAEEIAPRVTSGEFKSVKQICEAYNVSYSKFNGAVKAMLGTFGYTTRRRAGIAKIS